MGGEAEQGGGGREGGKSGLNADSGARGGRKGSAEKGFCIPIKAVLRSKVFLCCLRH